MRGDKGDGTPAGVAEARQRWAWANDGHIPDIVRCSAVPYIYEVKCFSPFTAGGLAGARNAAGGGVPSEREGDRIAFGCTEEAARRRVYGLQQRGLPTDPPHDRHSGRGFVAACAGDYADALSKGHGVLLLVTESTGALSPALVWLLRRLARSATLPEGCDTTAYGTSRGSPRAFFPHHAAAISAAIIGADAHAILADAASRNLQDSLLGLPQHARA